MNMKILPTAFTMKKISVNHSMPVGILQPTWLKLVAPPAGITAGVPPVQRTRRDQMNCRITPQPSAAQKRWSMNNPVLKVNISLIFFFFLCLCVLDLYINYDESQEEKIIPRPLSWLMVLFTSKPSALQFCRAPLPLQAPRPSKGWHPYAITTDFWCAYCTFFWQNRVISVYLS